MTTINNIYSAINSFAPFRYAESWDNAGLLIGDANKEIKSALICLDVTDETIEEAIRLGVKLIITHHPVIFHGLKSIKGNSNVHKLIRNDIAVISAHTNLDIAKGFVNDVLAERIGLIDIEDFEEVSAKSDKGEALSLGRIGLLKEPMNAKTFALQIKTALNCQAVEFVGSDSIKRVAVCGGAGASLIKTAIAKNADALVTSDIDHDEFLFAHEMGIALFDAGHYYTEAIVLEKLCNTLKENLSEVEFILTKTEHITTTI